MKKLFQLNLWLLLVSSAAAQEANPPASVPQPPTKVLRVYDWNDLAQKHQLAGGEVVQMDGMSVLKIESTNNPPWDYNFGGYRLDMPFEVSILKTTNSVIKNTAWVACEFKYEGVWSGSVINTKREVWNESGDLKLVEYYPPSASGGDERIKTTYIDFAGTSNWQLYKFAVDRTKFESSPTKLELKFLFAGHGTVYIRPIKLLGVTGNWWSAKQSGLVGGAAGIFGGVVGCFGGLLGCLAGFGKARKFVLTTTKIFIALGMLLTITGIVAIACGQPFFVWYVFLLPGVMLTLIFSLNFPLIQRRYDDLEIRRMASIDALGS
jgi:hypothetical protein